MTTNKVINIPFINNVLIQQQTDGGLVNIAPIVDLVNEKRLRQGKAEVQVKNYFESDTAQEYLTTLLNDSQLIEITGEKATVEKATTTIPLENQQVTIIEEQKKITIDELKQIGVYKKTRGKYEGTWFTPLLAVDIVGWLDPEIKLYFNKLIMKELFKKRITVSDKIRTLTDKIVEKFGSQDSSYFMRFNYLINQKIFGNNYQGIRDDATEEQFNNICKLIDTMLIYINEGIDSNIQAVLNRINKINL